MSIFQESVYKIIFIRRRLGLLLLLTEMDLVKLWRKKLHGVWGKKDVGVSNGQRKVRVNISKMQTRSDRLYVNL